MVTSPAEAVMVRRFSEPVKACSRMSPVLVVASIVPPLPSWRISIGLLTLPMPLTALSAMLTPLIRALVPTSWIAPFEVMEVVPLVFATPPLRITSRPVALEVIETFAVASPKKEMPMLREACRVVVVTFCSRVSFM